MKKRISGKRIGVYIGIVALLLGVTIGAVNVGKRVKSGAKAGNAPELPSVEATITDAKEVVTTEDTKETTTESATEEAVLEKPSTAGKSEYKEEDKKDGKTSESGNANDTKPSTHQTSGNTHPTTNGSTNNGGSVTPAPASTTPETVKENPKACEHAWKEVTKRVWVDPVEHTEEVEVVVTPAGYTTEYHTEEHAFCRNCGDMGVMSVQSIADHVDSCQGGNSSYWFDDVEVPVQVWHDAVTKKETKTVIDKEGYEKEEVVGYECTKCGATKSK